MDFAAYYQRIGDRLKLELEDARGMLQHNGNRGAQAENIFRSFLRNHVSRNLDVGHGEVIDRHGSHAGTSTGDGQIDVLVVDADHPRFAQISEPSLYFIEGILAAAEVKSTLELSDAEDIVKKAAAFKRLRTELGYGDSVIISTHDVDRYLNHRPYFIFAFKSKTPLDAFVARILEYQASLGLGETQHVDAVFLLDRGAAINLGSGNGGLAVLGPDGQPVSGWIKEKRPTMVALISWLSEVMPRISRNAPIVRNYMTRSKEEMILEQNR